MNEAKKLDESIRSTDCDVEEVNEALRLWQTQLSNLDYLLSYAVLLAKSRITTDRRTAASHLKYLVTQEHNLQATLFQYSIVLYSLEQYDSARQTIASLLRLEPESKQIKDLHAAMSYKHKKHDEEMNTRRKQNAAVTTAVTLLGSVAVAIGFVLASRKK